jgi:carbonic anhydrase/acetyltransferase-like protein (isoleucine patch superfamily)
MTTSRTDPTGPGRPIRALGDDRPQVPASAWVAPTATVVGDVELGEGSSVWYSAVVRGDLEGIRIGARSNVQDGCTLHADPGYPLTVGDGVSLGHNVVLHGCTVEDDCLIGMGAVVLNGAVIRRGSLVAAGATVLGGTVVPPGSLVAGLPAKVRREIAEEEVADVRKNADVYVELAQRHARDLA